MRRESARDAVSPSIVPSSHEVQRWDKTQGRVCTADKFRVDLNSTAKSPWNVSAGYVFAKSFIEAELYECTNAEEVRKAFWTHFNTLREHWKKSVGLISHADQAKKLRQHGRDERKRGVCCMITAALEVLIIGFFRSYSIGALNW